MAIIDGAFLDHVCPTHHHGPPSTGPETMSATQADAAAGPRRLGRKLRRASWVDPSTGERSKRQFTLREASSRPNGSAEERTPLLPNGHGTRHDPDEDPASSSLWTFGCRYAHRAWTYVSSREGKDVLKCSLAYLIGTSATFVPAVSGLFGHKQDSKHMVATITVWFSPGRTLGSMHEATVLAFIAFCYGGLISFTSMGISMFFKDQNLLLVGHIIVLIVFVGGGLGSIAWIKQRLAHPLVNVATSLASLCCITILVREGSVQEGFFSTNRIEQVLLMVLCGILITTAVNGLIFPNFARQKLTDEFERNTDLLGEMLVSITRAFLQGRENDLQDNFFKSLSKNHEDSLSALSKHLIEAKREHLLLGNERLYAVEARLVECLVGLSQDLGGLRSAADAQFSFINQISENDEMDVQKTRRPPQIQSSTRKTSQAPGILDAITEAPEENESRAGDDSATSSFEPTPLTASSVVYNGSPVDSTATLAPPSATSRISTELERQDSITTSMARGPGELFVTFISQLGPPIKSLVYTLKQTLDQLPFQDATVKPPWWNLWTARHHQVAVNEHFHSSLHLAVDLYRQSRREALATLYQSRAIRTATTSPQRSAETQSGPRAPTQGRLHFGRDPEEVLADIEEVSACLGHCSFSLLDFAEDLLTYLDILEDLKYEMENNAHSWNWLLFWRGSGGEEQPISRTTTFHQGDEEQHVNASIAAEVTKAEELVEAKSPMEKPWYHKIYTTLRFMRREDIRFGIKVGIGAALYALPAFMEETRPFFVHWRGEWGLVSYMVVCVMTLGASTTTATQRFVGTCIGAAVAICAWIISNSNGVANPWILGFISWLVSLACFYLIVHDNAPMGRFVLLTYNLGALYSYTLSMHDDDDDDDEGGIDPAIWAIVWHRVISVFVGILWGLFVTRMIWPLSARRKIRDGLCVLFLRMGLIWKRDPLAKVLQGQSKLSPLMDIREESHLQSFLATLKSLRKAAASEFELRGPFPDTQFGAILSSAGQMLDAFHAMNTSIQKNSKYTPGEAAVMHYTRSERAALSARISHLFTVLASSLKLRYPMNDFLPTIDNSRDRLLARISEYRRTSEAREVTTEQDYEMLYAFVLVTGQISESIQDVSAEIDSLFGTLNEEDLKLY